MAEKIISLQNPKIKNIVKLQQKSSERKKQNLIVIEGFREINLAMNAGFNIQAVFVNTDILNEEQISDKLNSNDIHYFEISQEVYEKIAYRDSTEGIVAIAEPKFYNLSDLQLKERPLIIVLESIEKPGNLGAILRTADAANVDAVLICDPLTDIYNPNVIRSSVGCVFTNQVVSTTSDDAIKWFKKNNIKTYAAALTARNSYHETDFTGAAAIVMGTEADGLTDKWLNEADQQVIIPMSGYIDSLNVSTSTAILVFEAMRQRNFYK